MGIQKKKSKCSWECLGKEPVWFHSPNVWVQSTHMVCNDCKKNRFRNNSEQNVHRFILVCQNITHISTLSKGMSKSLYNNPCLDARCKF